MRIMRKYNSPNNILFTTLIVLILALANPMPTNRFAFSSSTRSRKLSSRVSSSQLNHNLKKADDYVDCVIVGSGPAGLATSIAISKASPSSSVVMFEKDAFEPKGSTIAISSSGYKSLKKLHPPLVTKLKDTAVRLTTGVKLEKWTYDKEEEERKQLVAENEFLVKRVVKKSIKKMIVKLVSLGSRFVVKFHSWHEVRMYLKDEADKLHEQKLSTINDSSTTLHEPLVHTNYILTNVRDRNNDDDTQSQEQHQHRFELTFQNTKIGKERKIFSKYLFACDGTMSAVRSKLPNEPQTLLSVNKSVWRGSAPNYNLNSAIIWRCPANDDTSGRSAAVFPAGGGLGTAWSVISDIEDGRSKSTEEARARVLKVVETMNSVDHNPDYDILKQCIDGSGTIIENKLHVRDLDKPWESAYDGLIYIGDAAHPVRPTGEGLALAFEDANVLYQLISKFGLSDATLRKYEDERFLPVKIISEKVRLQAESAYKKR